MGAEGFFCGINEPDVLIAHLPQFLGKDIHIAVQLGLHVIIQSKDAAFFQHPQALQQQFVHIGSHDIVVDIVADDRVKTLIGEIQMIGVTMPEHTPGGHAFTCGVFLTEGLAVIVNSSPVVHASDLCLRPGQGRTNRQGSGAAADFQETALAVIVQMRENDPVNLFHDPAAAKGILAPDPCDPDQQGCQRRRNN